MQQESNSKILKFFERIMNECSNGNDVSKTRFIKMNQPLSEEEKMEQETTTEDQVIVEEEGDTENTELLNNGTKSVIFRETTV